MSQKFYFRADSSYELGSGHVIRCLTLAQYLVKNGVSKDDIYFLAKPFPGFLGNLVAEQNYNLVDIPIEENEELLATTSIALISKTKKSTLIVDNYSLSSKYETQIQPHSKKIVVIDDLENRPHNCSILLDQNYRRNPENTYIDLVPKNALRFIGPSYALLRPSFFKTKKGPIHSIKNILIFFGGTDNSGETLRFIYELSPLKFNFVFHVLVAQSNVDVEKLNVISDTRFEIHVNPPNIEELMNRCDFYFGSGGSITWERMAVGLPGAVTTVAENQVMIAEELATAKPPLHYHLGSALGYSYQNLISFLDSLKLEEVNAMKSRGQHLINPKKLQDLLTAILQ